MGTRDGGFNYTGIIRELSYAFDDVLYASRLLDHIIPIESVTPEQRLARELGHLRAALGRLKGTFQAVHERAQSLATEVALTEAPMMDSIADAQKVAAKLDTSHLPPELRGR